MQSDDLVDQCQLHFRREINQIEEHQVEFFKGYSQDFEQITIDQKINLQPIKLFVEEAFASTVHSHDVLDAYFLCC